MNEYAKRVNEIRRGLDEIEQRIKSGKATGREVYEVLELNTSLMDLYDDMAENPVPEKPLVVKMRESGELIKFDNKDQVAAWLTGSK